ncbi:MAG: type III polyketide synthase [Parachlamydiaceae bacterium]|nr:type III polyketide synthase [Parachlamydiaceae bacterium]
MRPKILSLATVNPPNVWSQEEIADKMIDMLHLDTEKASLLRKIYQNSAIGFRHSVIPDFKQERDKWHFWGKDYPNSLPSTSKRNEVYKRETPRLAHSAALKAINAWGGSPSEITHVIFVSCTGVMAPGVEFTLINLLGLNRFVHRLGINLMGCFGAFKGLQVANAFAKENPQHRILLVCTELCSLHLQADQSHDNLLANALFADGSAAAIVGCELRPNETSLYSIERQSSLALENTLDKMTWDIGDHGFFMQLSSFVPPLIKRHIQTLVGPLLKDKVEISECDWPIHPGGKSIIQALERALDLNETQTKASWETLWNYGNMSSSTFLFVLDRLHQQKNEREWAVGIGFGPGLSMEGILLQKGN